MKPMNAITRISFLIMLSFISLSSLKAQTANNGNAVSKVKFVGVEGDLLVFDLDIKDLPAGTSTLRIRDEQRNIIFEEKIKGSQLRKRYKIFREQYSGLQFEVIQGREIMNEKFRFNYRLEEKFDVEKA